jgi:hypothetical protein
MPHPDRRGRRGDRAVSGRAPGSNCPSSGTGGSQCTATVGVITGPAAFTTVNLSGSPQAVVSATTVTGNTTVTWNPVIQVAIPAGAIGGTYTATITHSVS